MVSRPLDAAVTKIIIIISLLGVRISGGFNLTSLTLEDDDGGDNYTVYLPFTDYDYQRMSDIEQEYLIEEEKRHNLTRTLNGILKNYDKAVRPGHGGKPLTLQADMFALSIGPIEELTMSFTLDVFFRQRWIDPRLQYTEKYKVLSLNTKMLDVIWHPDTYFHNGRKSYGHSITTPNRLFRVYPTGEVLYTQRLTIVTECKMDFKKYPQDLQICSVTFGSNSFSTEDVIYIWHSNEVDVSDDLRLSQFDLEQWKVHSETKKSSRIGDRTILTVDFYLNRRLGYFMIQFYIPCILITVLSFVTFWIHPEAVPARVSLSIMTVLTLTTLGWNTRDGLPKVSYVKALDWYLSFCFFLVFGTIIEFALVLYYTKHKEYFASDKEIVKEVDSSEINTAYLSINDTKYKQLRKNTSSFSGYTHERKNSLSEETYRDDNADCEVSDDDKSSMKKLFQCITIFLHCLTGAKFFLDYNIKNHSTGWREKKEHGSNNIDMASRVLFPFLFVLMNIIYWVVYL